METELVPSPQVNYIINLLTEKWFGVFQRHQLLVGVLFRVNGFPVLFGNV